MKPDNTPTPETDAAILLQELDSLPSEFEYVTPEFARKLEHERDEARERIEMLEIRHAAAMLHNHGVVDENAALRTRAETAERERGDYKHKLFIEEQNRNALAVMGHQLTLADEMAEALVKYDSLLITHPHLYRDNGMLLCRYRASRGKEGRT